MSLCCQVRLLVAVSGLVAHLSAAQELDDHVDGLYLARRYADRRFPHSVGKGDWHVEGLKGLREPQTVLLRDRGLHQRYERPPDVPAAAESPAHNVTFRVGGPAGGGLDDAM